MYKSYSNVRIFLGKSFWCFFEEIILVFLSKSPNSVKKKSKVIKKWLFYSTLNHLLNTSIFHIFYATATLMYHTQQSQKPAPNSCINSFVSVNLSNLKVWCLCFLYIQQTTYNFFFLIDFTVIIYRNSHPVWLYILLVYEVLSSLVWDVWLLFSTLQNTIIS